jgi:hypothetical protein
MSTPRTTTAPPGEGLKTLKERQSAVMHISLPETPKDGLRSCADCGQERPQSAFGPDKTRRDGLNRRCRQCDALRSRDYYARNREKVLARVIARNKAQGAPSGAPVEEQTA